MTGYMLSSETLLKLKTFLYKHYMPVLERTRQTIPWLVSFHPNQHTFIQLKQMNITA